MRILVAGREGQVARSLAALDNQTSDISVVAAGRPRLDLTDRVSIDRAIAEFSPNIIVNPAAYTAVDQAEQEVETAFAVNVQGASNIASAAAAANLPIIHISTDYVFSGDKTDPYRETDPTGPTGIYGRSKLEGETAVLASNPASVILRTAWVHSPYGNNFVKTMLRLAADRDVVKVVADQHGSPTYAPDIAAGILQVARHAAAAPDGEEWRGVFHMVSQGETHWAGFAEAIFAISRQRGGPHAQVLPIGTADYPTPARRPANSRLDSSLFQHTFSHRLPDWQNGVERCVEALLAPAGNDAA